MIQKLLASPKQRPLLDRGHKKSLLHNKALLLFIGVVLLALLALALVFLQANATAMNLKKTVAANRNDLRVSAKSTTEKVTSVKDEEGANLKVALGSLNQFTAQVDTIADTCAKAETPWVPALAKNFKTLSAECDSLTATARELRDSLNGFLPVAQYQVELLNATNPIVAFQSGNNKTDTKQAIGAWGSFKSELQKVTPPEVLVTYNTELINSSSDVIATYEQLQQAQTSKDTRATTAAIKSLDLHYKKVNQLGEQMQDELVLSQKKLYQAAQKI
ncbi:hypothetical protein CYG49_00785 [Candidatus Saccharibacteria bacterium]|nr:MAG: hypothetical protein CYG49_00785 [Candidatus Saccharibacteria bacterium]